MKKFYLLFVSILVSFTSCAIAATPGESQLNTAGVLIAIESYRCGKFLEDHYIPPTAPEPGTPTQPRVHEILDRLLHGQFSILRHLWQSRNWGRQYRFRLEQEDKDRRYLQVMADSYPSMITRNKKEATMLLDSVMKRLVQKTVLSGLPNNVDPATQNFVFPKFKLAFESLITNATSPEQLIYISGLMIRLELDLKDEMNKIVLLKLNMQEELQLHIRKRIAEFIPHDYSSPLETQTAISIDGDENFIKFHDRLLEIADRHISEMINTAYSLEAIEEIIANAKTEIAEARIEVL